MKFFHAPTFIISLAIGLFLVYISNPNKNTIYVYPTPDNVNKLLYRDKTKTCFQFKPELIKCPSNNDLIDNYKVQ
jgi:hypothetical protein